MRRVIAIWGGVLVLALLAATLTEAALAAGRRGGLADDVLLRARFAPSPTPSTTPKAIPSPTPSVASTPTPAPTPTPTPARPTAVTNSFVHLRAGKSTATPILLDFNGGTVVYLLPDSDAQWQQVEYNGTVGYVFKSYLAY